MHNRKIIAKGIIVATALSNAPVDSLANTIEEYKLINMEDNAKENKMGDSIKNLFAKIVEPIENLISEPKETIKVNKNIVKNSVLEISLADGEFVPDLTGNPSGYETVKVITTGNKKLVKADYNNLRLSGIPKVDLSSANSDSIPSGAFADATHLTEFKFPKGITSIGETSSSIGAFRKCNGLTGDLVIPNSVTSIGGSAFSGCSGLTGDLVIPKSVTSIGSSAFEGCSGLTGELVIPEGVTSIGNSTFYGCSGLTGNLVIPNSVTSIGDSAFRKCSRLTGNLVIPNSVTSIGDSAFSGCSGLTGDLVIPEGVTSVGGSTFYGCSGLTGNLVIPEGVTSIGTSAFRGCSGLTGNLVIPEGVTSIEYGAFYECSGFNGNLVIPESATSIGASAFYRCSGLTGDLVIPEGVTSIGNYAFYNCSRLTGNVVIPEEITEIGSLAFLECNNIEKILIKVDSSAINTNYKQNIIKNLPDTSQTVIDVPYDFNITGTWLETTSKTIGKPVIKNVINGVESDLINLKGEKVSLYIPSLYKECNVAVLKDGEPYTLPSKDINGKHIFTESGVYELTVTTDLGNTSIINFEVEDPQFKNAEETVKNAEQSKKPADIETARDLVNQLPECSIKDQLQDRLDAIFPNLAVRKRNCYG